MVGPRSAVNTSRPWLPHPLAQKRSGVMRLPSITAAFNVAALVTVCGTLPTQAADSSSRNPGSVVGAFPSSVMPNATPLNLPHTFAPGELPPEPPAAVHPKLHDAWQNIPKAHHITPHLEPHNGVFHAPLNKPNMSAEAISRRNGSETDISATTFFSSNWSGAAIAADVKKYRRAAVAMTVLVPTQSPPFGSCVDPTGKANYTAIWTASMVSAATP